MSILFVPCSSEIPLINYNHTMRKPKSLEDISPNLMHDTTWKKLAESGSDRFCIWGLANGDRNAVTFDKLRIGDYVVFYRNENGRRKLFCRGKVAAKEKNDKYGMKLWTMDEKGRVFTLLFFLTDCVEIDSPIDPEEMGYSPECRFQSSILFTLGSSNFYYIKKKMEVSGRKLC